MTNKLRFRHLKKRGIVDSWAQLRNLVEKHNFPRGKMLSPNCRVWDEEDELEPWLESRPVEGPELRGAALARQGRPRKAQVALMENVAPVEAPLTPPPPVKTPARPSRYPRSTAVRRRRDLPEPVD